jgi:hyperosmotically inducible periplasmic protein
LALGKDATLHAFNVRVKDNGAGAVTLSGSVQEQGQSYKAETIAKDVSGVTGVTNDLNVMETN